MTHSSQAISHTTRRLRIRHTLVTTGVLGALWLVMTNGSVSSWLVGIPALASAVWVRNRLASDGGQRISLFGLARFVPFFLYESLRGGTAVAKRTLTPRMQIESRFFRYRTTLTCSMARVLFINCVSVLPGTLAADLHEEWLEVHALGDEAEALVELEKLEHAIKQLYNSGVNP